jgi:membrane fusion protein
MRSDLFREQVLRRDLHMEAGEPVLYQPPGLRVLFVLFTGLLLALLTFAATAQISRTEVVRGHLSTDAGVTRVHAPRPGIVAEIRVQEGAVVAKGETLLLVDPGMTDAVGQQARVHVREQLALQASALQEQRHLLQVREQTGVAHLERRLAALRQELLLREQQEALLGERLDIAVQASQRSALLLESQVTSAAAHSQVVEAHVIARQALLAHTLESRQREEGLVALLQEKAQLSLEIRNERLRLELALSQLAVQTQEREVQQAYSINAPVAGSVGTLLVEAGSQVEPGRPVLSLLPAAGTLVAQLFVPSRAAGRLQVGQSLLLSYDAFPRNIFGSFPARVSRLSGATVDPREFQVPFETAEPVYLVEAELALGREESEALLPLRAGMQFTAQIVTGRQTLLARVTAPLRALEQRL